MTDRTLWPGTWYRASWTVSTSLEEDVIGLAALEGCEGARTRRAGPGRVSVEVWFGTLEGAESAVERLASALESLFTDAGFTVADQHRVARPAWTLIVSDLITVGVKK